MTACAAILTGLLGNASYGAAYVFSNVADSSGALNFNPGSSRPSINSTGTAAFVAGVDAGGTGIFTGNGGGVTTVLTSQGSPFASFNRPQISSTGAIAFVGFPDAAGSGVYIRSGGTTTTVSDFSGPMASYFSDVGINSSGTVVFGGEQDNSDRGIFTGNGGSVATAANTTGQFDAFGSSPSINTSGAVAFRASRDTSGSGVYRATAGGTLTPIATTDGGTFAGFNEAPSINDSNRVAFVGTEGVYTGDGGALTTVVTLSGTSFSGFSAVNINNVGGVAFLASLDNGQAGLFTGSDPVNNKIVTTGEDLFGSPLVDLRVGPKFLNDAGQTAFYFQLEDGRNGVAIASLIPEPGSLALLVSAGAGLTLSRRRRRPGLA